MANTSRPFGFRPSRHLNGHPLNGKATLYAFSASDAAAAYKGDVVSFDATYRATALTDAYAPGIQLVKAATAAVTTALQRGVIVGFVPEPEFNQTASASLGLMYRVGSTARYVWVMDDYHVIYEVEELGNTWTTSASNALNKLIDIDYTTAASTRTGISGAKVAASTVSVSAVKPFRVLRYTQRPDNFNFTAADTNSRAHLDVLLANTDLSPALPTYTVSA